VVVLNDLAQGRGLLVTEVQVATVALVFLFSEYPILLRQSSLVV
jgi:hypothetical protein